MIKFWIVSLLALAGYINTLSIPVHAQSTPQIQITEISAFGSTQENGCKSVVVEHGRCAFDKWVELTNVSSNTASLSQYQLSFGTTPTPKNTITFAQDTAIAAHSSVIVAYDEVNFVSANITSALVYSGKMLYLSNRETGQISVTLYDAARQVVNTIAIQKNYVATQNSYSFEKLNGEWIPATTEFSPHNFGTPGWVPSAVVQSELIVPTKPVLAIAPYTAQSLAISTPVLIPHVSIEAVVSPVLENTQASLPVTLKMAMPATLITQTMQEIVAQMQSIELDTLVKNTQAVQLDTTAKIALPIIVPIAQILNSKVHIEVSWLVAALMIAITRVFVVAFSQKTAIFTRQTAII